MSTKLNQIIAVAQGTKSRCESELTKAYQLLQKADLLNGIARKYRPLDEENGEKLPEEKKHVQYTVKKAVGDVSRALTELFDVVSVQDATNCEAKSDVKVDEKVLLKSVPVTHLLFLEKKLVDLHTFVDKLPTLDSAEEWTFDTTTDVFKTAVHQTARTKKETNVLVKYPATKEHPAQTELVSEDKIVGTWDKIGFSGAIPAKNKNEMLQRVAKLQKAVKFAREEANSVDVSDYKTGKPVMEYVFGADLV